MFNETRDYTYLDIVCDSFFTDRQNVDKACSKLREYVESSEHWY